MPKVSIIVPVYNAEKYLSATLDSAVQQTFSDLEIVCVDDGSTDASLQILKDYQVRDPRVKVVTQKNGGGSAARNKGIAHATADYIMFLDSDDLYAKTIVEHAYDRAIKTGTDIVFYNFARFVGRPTKLAVINKHIPHGDVDTFTKETYADRFFDDLAIITWNKLVKKNVITLNNLAFNTELSHNHDVDFSVRLMLAAENYSWLNEVGYYYRTNDTGLTATKRSDPTNVLKILLKLNQQVAAKYKIVKPTFNRYVAEMIVGTVEKYRHDATKVKQVFDYSREVVIPEVGLSGQDERHGIFKMIEAGDYEKLMAYINHPKQKIRGRMRNLYDVAQDVLARFTV